MSLPKFMRNPRSTRLASTTAHRMFRSVPATSLSAKMVYLMVAINGLALDAFSLRRMGSASRIYRVIVWTLMATRCLQPYLGQLGRSVALMTFSIATATFAATCSAGMRKYAAEKNTGA